MFSSKLVSRVIYSIIIIASLYSNKVFEGKTNVITWDVYGYYLYLPATIHYQQIRQYDFTKEHFKNYKISSNFYQLNLVDSSRQIYAPIYTIGMAALYSPFYLAAIPCASVFGYPNDGLSFPFQLAIVLASLVYAGIGIYYLRRFLLVFFEDKIVALTLVILLFGTNYFHYIVFESGMPHTYLFALYSIWLFQVYKWHEQPTYLSSFLIGFIAALACLARPSEGIIVLLFLFYKVYSWTSFKAKVQFLISNFKYFFIIGIVGLISISPQIIYWKYSFGQWIYNGYVGHHFDFLQPHIIDGLFSYRKGWLVYTPIMLLSLIGLFFVWKKEYKSWAIGLILFAVLNIYIVYSWHIWWYASTFGSRAVIQSYAFLSIPLAAFLQSILDAKNKVIYTILGLFIIACIALNHFQDWQYRQRILPLDGTTKTYYWEIFGQTQLPAKDVKKYLDIDEKLPNKHFKSNSLAHIQLDTPQTLLKSSNEYSQTIIYTIDSPKKENILSNNWLKIKATVWTSGDLFGEYDVANLVFSLERKDKTLKWIGVQFPRFIVIKTWESVHYEVQLPKLEQGDVIKTFVWNTSKDTIQLKEIELIHLQE